MPAENALTLDWQDRPYAEFLAEAKRVGAYDGVESRRTSVVEATVCQTPSSRAQCTYVHEPSGVWIWVLNNKGVAVRAWYVTPGLDVPAAEVFTVCPFHLRLADPTAHMEVLLREGALVSRFQELLGETLTWFFSPDRKLVITFTGRESTAGSARVRSLAASPEFREKVIVNG